MMSSRWGSSDRVSVGLAINPYPIPLDTPTSFLVLDESGRREKDFKIGCRI